MNKHAKNIYCVATTFLIPKISSKMGFVILNLRRNFFLFIYKIRFNHKNP